MRHWYVRAEVHSEKSPRFMAGFPESRLGRADRFQAVGLSPGQRGFAETDAVIRINLLVAALGQEITRFGRKPDQSFLPFIRRDNQEDTG